MSGGLGEWIVLGSLILTAGALHAQTQADMNQDTCAQYKKADQWLNQTYSQVLKDYAKDPEFHQAQASAACLDSVSRRASGRALSKDQQTG
jgi:uncharacterized protein YecT (DUF1311 family)